MTKKILLAAAVIFILIIAVVFVQALLRSNFSLFAKTATVKTGDTTYRLEIADTPDKRTKGLSGRKSLPENRGMLFTFETPDYYSFWMKDMQFPIDIIFLKDNTVTTVYSDVPQPQNALEDLTVYQPNSPSNQVIELNAGQAKKSEITTGEKLDIAL